MIDRNNYCKDCDRSIYANGALAKSCDSNIENNGYYNHAGIEVENEEVVVDMFAKGIYQVLQDNGRALFDLRGAENES